MLPTIRQLQYLKLLAEHGAFGKAAEAAHVTQPTLSAGIQELERTLGAPVVDDARRLGAVLQHRRDVLMQAPWYGLPHKFHGRFAAEYWPDHLDLADDPRPWSPEARVRLGYPGHAFARFVVADPAEITAQPALWQMLTARCTPALRDARLTVFACEGLRR